MWLVALQAGPLGAQSEAAEPEDAGAPWTVLDRRPADGEQCIVCRQAIDYGEIVEVRYKGRAFHVSEGMLEEFQADPERYFESMQARAALFDETAMETPPMQTGWLSFGLYVLVGLVFGAACSYIALDRGLPALGWFFAGLLANVLALAALLTRPRRQEVIAPGLAKVPATHSPEPCLHCGHTNHPSATVCSWCGRALEPHMKAEVGRA